MDATGTKSVALKFVVFFIDYSHLGNGKMEHKSCIWSEQLTSYYDSNNYPEK